MSARFTDSAATDDARVLAADLHDSVVAELTLLILEMEQFKREQYNRDAVQEAVSGFQTTARDALAHLRDLIHGIQSGPVNLENGFVEALRTGPLAEIRERAGIATRVTMSPGWPRHLDAFTALNLYRILEEGLRNAAAHSGARNVRVILRDEDDTLVLEIVDDGTGLAPLQLKGHGMTGMQQRAMVLGGTLEVANGERRGAVVRLTVPRR